MVKVKSYSENCLEQLPVWKRLLALAGFEFRSNETMNNKDLDNTAQILGFIREIALCFEERFS